MGWLFETENDRREKIVISYAGQICTYMRNITSRIEQDGGLNYDNSSFILEKMQSIISIKEKMESELSQLPQSRIGKLYLPWVDGRNIPFHLWAGCYQMGALQLQKMINEFY